MIEIFLDIETTGLSFNEGDKIVEIACIETNDMIPTSKTFHKLINPQRNVPQEAFKIHGFSNEFLKTKETFNLIADEFLEFIKNKTLIIHNATFDVGFLNHELKLLKKDVIKKENIIDSLELARGKFPGSPNSLDALCRKFNIDLSKRIKHNAILDCQLLREVYINLLDAKEPKLLFSEEKTLFTSEKNIGKSVEYCKEIILPNNSEIDDHKKLLKTEIKKNFY
ncbi:DNA polymerase III subunit epsilon [Pelagibacteraceae bacterium]|nr:DNA polymerase III subunit epsilon [Pelagibacteraceae bacterium]